MESQSFVSLKHNVSFVDISDQYSFNEDLIVKFEYHDYIPQEGDRIAIFKLGWTSVKDYVLFEWVPVNSTEKICQVTFNKHIVPKNTNEIYQICYISGENELHGVSTPFQFGICNTPLSSLMNSTSTAIISLQKENVMDKEKEIMKLKEDNAILKESLKAVIAQKNHPICKHDSDIRDLKSLTEHLKLCFSNQQEEINLLKSKIVEGGEEYRKLYLEKLKIERKYEKLKSTKDEKILNVSANFDIGDLKSIPPFPFPQ